MTAGPGAPRAVAVIPMSSRRASAAAELGKFRHEQQTGHSVFAAIGLPLSECCGCLRHRPVSTRTGNGPFCKSCARRPLERCANCGQERLIPRLRTRGRSRWCFELHCPGHGSVRSS